MRGMNEIEAKYRVENLIDVKKTLQALGAKYLGTFLQTDFFYDKPTGELRKAGCGLRIRKLEVLQSPPSEQVDNRPVVTFKGPIEAKANIKVRRELETKLDSADVLEEIFQAVAGFENVWTIQKRRSSYRLGSCQVELDELPLLGFFVEIEGPEEDIENNRNSLGIKTSHLNASYLHMLLEKCQEMGITSNNITFEQFSACDES